MTQATEKQVNYINILTDGHRKGIQSDWALNGYRNPQRQALKVKHGNDGYWDLTADELAQEWQETVKGTLTYLDELDSAAPDMTVGEASELIDQLKSGSIVWMYHHSRGVL